MAGLRPRGLAAAGEVGRAPKRWGVLLLGGSGSWQELTGCLWEEEIQELLPAGWSCPPRYQPHPLPAESHRAPLGMKIALLSIQRTDNGLFSSQNTEKEVCWQ